MRWQAKTPKGDVMDAAIEEAQNAIQDAIVEEIGKDRGDDSAQGRVEWLASRGPQERQEECGPACSAGNSAVV